MKPSARALLNVRVPLCDGTELATHVYLPLSEGPFPVLFVRTPYDAWGSAEVLEWVGHGYACVRQDTRGCSLSGGEEDRWFCEKADGEEALRWVMAQPWCNGNVTMYGGSYPAFTQLAAALSGNPGLKCITPALIGAEIYHAWYWGGVLRFGRLSRWALKADPVMDQKEFEKTLPVCDGDLYARARRIPYWREVLAHPHGEDAFWDATSFGRHAANVRAPAFIRTGWFDLFVCDVFDLFNALRHHGGSEAARRHTRLIVGPWPHDINRTQVGEEDFGEAGKIRDLYEQELAFMDHFTDGRGGYDLGAAPIRLFVMGANEWRDEYEWPLARTRWTEFFLSSGGRANTSKGDGRLGAAPSGPADMFDYDPANPVPTHGGAWDFETIGPRDQGAIEQRPDVLVYTSEALAEDLEVTGPVEVKLFAASSAVTTDFTAKLVEVRPDGRAMSVTDGIVRASHRQPGRVSPPLAPGEVNEFTIRCNPTSWVFKQGHRLRLEISSSNFPVFARNLNSGLPEEEDRQIIVARQSVHHGAAHPSRLVLPVIPVK